MKKIYIIFSILLLVTFSATTYAQQNPTKAESIVRPDGSKEIRLSDANGKIITTLKASKGESIQAKHIDYMAKQPKPQPVISTTRVISNTTVTTTAGENSKAIVPKRSDIEDKK